MEKIRYFDYAATTATKEEVLKEMLPYFTLNYGNASSIYSIGRKSKKAVEESRHKVAHAIGAEAKEIIRREYNWKFISDRYAEVFMNM